MSIQLAMKSALKTSPPQQKGMIGLDHFDRARERSGQACDLCEFFRRQVVQIFVERIARTDPVLDSIEAGEQ